MATQIIRLNSDFLQFDVATLTFDNGCNITDHPVETGANVSDHSQRLPATIAITGTVSETCYDYQALNMPVQRRGSAALFLDAIAGTTIPPLPAETVTISNETYGVFSGYMLQSWTHVLDNVSRAEFVCLFKQVSLAVATFTGIPASAPAGAASASFGAGTSAGEQGTTSTAAAGAAGGAAGAAADTSTLGSLLYGL